MWTQSLTPASRTLWLPDREAGSRQLVDRARDLGRDLVGVVEMEVDPERVVLREHLAQLVVDALRQEDRHAAADPDDLDVRDLAEPAQDLLEQLRREGQAVAAGDEDVADLRGPPQVLELGLVVAAVEVLGRVADDPRAGAVPAVRGALGRDEHQHAIGVAVDEPRHRGVAVLGEGVLHHRGEGLLLAAGRDDLAADRVVGVVRVDQADEVGRDVDTELVRRRQAQALIVGEVQDRLDLGEVVDPVTQLPAPVVPLLVGDVRPERGAPADGRPAIGPEHACRVGEVDERRLGGRVRCILVSDGGLDLLGVHAADLLRQATDERPRTRPATHKVYAVCKSADDSAMVRSGPRIGSRERLSGNRPWQTEV